ncbi:MAG: YtxH domain-containing protein [Candidatus Zipacnadales bacterium]
MKEQEHGSGGMGTELAHLLLAGIIGVLVGAGLGLLLAPKPGAELRADLKAQASTAAEKAQVVQEKARELVEAAKQKISELQATSTETPEATQEADTSV